MQTVNINKQLENIQASANHPQLEQACKLFCQQHGFEHYLLYGSVFTNLLSPISCVIHSPGKAGRIKNNDIKEIINAAISKNTPVVSGNIDKTSPIYRSIFNVNRQTRSRLLSISFPVHFPHGKFALLYLATNTNKEEINNKVINTLSNGHQFAQEAGDKIIRILESRLDDRPPYLSVRESECLLLASDGATPRDISEQLGLSSHTVIYYLKTARQKLHTKNIQGAISKALLSGDISIQAGSEKD